MLTLYYTPSCPFCQRVLGEVENMGIKMQLKDISTDAVLANDLIARGGKRQVPYLDDSDRGIALYESGDIIAYLQEHYEHNAPASTFGGVRVHTEGDVCESCQ